MKAQRPMAIASTPKKPPTSVDPAQASPTPAASAPADRAPAASEQASPAQEDTGAEEAAEAVTLPKAGKGASRRIGGK